MWNCSVHIRLARTASVVSLKFEFKQHSLNFNPLCLKKNRWLERKGERNFFIFYFYFFLLKKMFITFTIKNTESLSLPWLSTSEVYMCTQPLHTHKQPSFHLPFAQLVHRKRTKNVCTWYTLFPWSQKISFSSACVQNIKTSCSIRWWFIFCYRYK